MSEDEAELEVLYSVFDRYFGNIDASEFEDGMAGEKSQRLRAALGADYYATARHGYCSGILQAANGDPTETFKVKDGDEFKILEELREKLQKSVNQNLCLNISKSEIEISKLKPTTISRLFHLYISIRSSELQPPNRWNPNLRSEVARETIESEAFDESHYLDAVKTCIGELQERRKRNQQRNQNLRERAIFEQCNFCWLDITGKKVRDPGGGQPTKFGSFASEIFDVLKCGSSVRGTARGYFKESRCID